MTHDTDFIEAGDNRVTTDFVGDVSSVSVYACLFLIVLTPKMEITMPRLRINGEMFPQFQSKSITETDQMGTSFQLTTCDNNKVTVHMTQPLQELIQVHCVVSSCKEMHCHSSILLNDMQNFDMESYNKAVKLIHQHRADYS